MVTLVHRLLLDVFGRLPRGLRRRVVRAVAPSYTVGAVCIIERDDGYVVLIRHRYRDQWGLPGGLLSRGEEPADAAVREVREEIGLDVDLVGEPAVVVDPHLRRVDVVYPARPVAGDLAPGRLVPCSPEIIAVGWFARDALPELQDETTTALAAARRALPDPE